MKRTDKKEEVEVVIATDTGMRFIDVKKDFDIKENSKEVFFGNYDITSVHVLSNGRYLVGVYEDVEYVQILNRSTGVI